MTMKVNAIDLDTYKHYLYGKKDHPLYCIIAGIHGNELRSQEGVSMLKNYFSSPKSCPLKDALLEKIQILLAPCFNTIGKECNVRFCPSPTTQLEYDKINDRIIGINPNLLPIGWQDANREWESNSTICKVHLDKILEMGPKSIVWNHDWVSQGGAMFCYAKSMENLDLSNDLYHHFNPIMYDLYGDVKKFCKIAKSELDVEESLECVLNRHLMDRGVENYVIEGNVADKKSPLFQFAVSLFLLVRFANVDISDQDLFKQIVNIVDEEFRDFECRVEKDVDLIEPKSVFHYGFLSQHYKK